jgi:hypothetical protein
MDDRPNLPGPGGSADPMAAIGNLVAGLQAEGGLDALVGKLRAGGLGDVVDSWVSTGTIARLNRLAGVALVDEPNAGSPDLDSVTAPVLAAFFPRSSRTDADGTPRHGWRLPVRSRWPPVARSADQRRRRAGRHPRPQIPLGGLRPRPEPALTNRPALADARRRTSSTVHPRRDCRRWRPTQRWPSAVMETTSSPPRGFTVPRAEPVVCCPPSVRRRTAPVLIWFSGTACSSSPSRTPKRCATSASDPR